MIVNANMYMYTYFEDVSISMLLRRFLRLYTIMYLHDQLCIITSVLLLLLTCVCSLLEVYLLLLEVYLQFMYAIHQEIHLIWKYLIILR